MEDALTRLEAAGATLVEIDLPDLMDLNEKTSFPIALYEATQNMDNYLRDSVKEVSFSDLTAGIKSPDVKAFFIGMARDENGDGKPDGVIPEAAYLEALNVHLPEMKRVLSDYFTEHNIDALIFPTTILPARPIEGTLEIIDHNGQAVPVFPTYTHNADYGSLAGLLGISMPAGLSKDGLPIGLELSAAANNDDHLLSIALAVESLFPALSAP